MSIQIKIRDENFHTTRSHIVSDRFSLQLDAGERFVEVRRIEDETDSEMPTNTERISAIEDSLVSITRTITSINTQLRDHRRYVNTEIQPGMIGRLDSQQMAVAALNHVVDQHSATLADFANNLNNVTNYLRTAPRIDPL